MTRMKSRRNPTRKSTLGHENPSDQNDETSSEPIIPLLVSTISQSIAFLSSNDILLPPSSSLALYSLISRSSHSLSLLLSSLSISPELLLPHSQIPKQPSAQFPFFRRLLSNPDPSLFFSNFHLTKSSFSLLLQNLTPSLTSISSSPFPPDLKLASFLFRLAHSAPFSFLSHRFFSSSSPSLSCRTFYEVCKSIIESLHSLFSLSSDLSRIIQGFHCMSLSKCCGVLSFFRIPVSGQLRGGSVLAQFVVDSEGRFLDLSVGWHGAMTPDMVIPKTKLYAVRESVLKKGKGYFIGGSCCPLTTWLMTPYKGRGSALKKEEGIFNAVHGRGMEMGDKAVRRLRGTWKLMRTEWKEECVEALPYIVVATCLLHNFLIKCKDDEVAEEVDELGLELGFVEFAGKEDVKGVRVRDSIAKQMSQGMMMMAS